MFFFSFNSSSPYEILCIGMSPIHSYPMEYMNKFIKDAYLNNRLASFIIDNEITCPADHVYWFYTDSSLHKDDFYTTIDAR